MSKQTKKPEVKQPLPNQKIEVTLENAPKLTVKYLELIFARLGYLIKVLEEKKKNG
jgi:hypothetical protein